MFVKKEDPTRYNVSKIMDLADFPKVEGYDFEKEFDFNAFIDQYSRMGFQGTCFGNAVKIVNKMIEDKADIYLAFTGNMISCGNREIIKYLVKHNRVKCIITTAAALEEDMIKCFKPFMVGTFDINGQSLHDNCIGRIGNLFIPADRYLYLERFLQKFFARLYKMQKDNNKIICTYEFARELGREIEGQDNYQDSFIYWAYKNNIPVFCPGITDGSIGDILSFFKRNNPEFLIDVTNDHVVLTKMLLNAENVGGIILGGGISKHYLLNASIFRDGLNYAVYINTGLYYDGSDSGGNQEEAISWGKISTDAIRTQVIADATLMFPLLVAGTFAKKENKKEK